jgi:tRNA dimethylallyltransferase
VIVAIFGPTGVGKTEVAIELAELLRGRGEDPVAVSADAYQVYEGLDVLVAKPSAAEFERLEHRLVSFVPVDQEFSVAQYSSRSHEQIDSLLEAGRRPIVVGGTGLYLRAALTDLELKPPPEEGLREQIERDLEEVGVETLHSRLPRELACAVHPNDRKRIVRALELERMGERAHERSDQLWSAQLRRPAAMFGIVMEREALAARLSARVDRMLAEGAIEEVESALERGASRTARKAIGFAELSAHLRGEASLNEVAERVGRRHRQYVRRQLTWIRKLAGVELVDRTSSSARSAAAVVLERLDRVSARWDSRSKSGRHSATTT